MVNALWVSGAWVVVLRKTAIGVHCTPRIEKLGVFVVVVVFLPMRSGLVLVFEVVMGTPGTHWT